MGWRYGSSLVYGEAEEELQRADGLSCGDNDVSHKRLLQKAIVLLT